MSTIFRVSALLGTITGAPVLLYFLATNFLFSWVGALMGLGFAVLYLVVVLWLLSRSPMWPQRNGAGWKWVLASLIWGGGVSFVLVMIGGLPITILTERLGWKLVSASFGGAYPEEIAKVLGVGVMLFAFRALNRPWHGLMTGALIGLGFEVAENVMYGSFGATMDPNSDVEGSLFVWGVRVFAGPGLHIVFSALAGWGLGQAVFMAGRSTAWRVGVAAWWLFVAFALHFAWNLMWPKEMWLLVNYLVVAAVMYPLVIWVWVRAHRMAKVDSSYAFSPAPVTSVQPVG